MANLETLLGHRPCPKCQEKAEPVDWKPGRGLIRT